MPPHRAACMAALLRLNNLRLLCGNCNRIKGDRGMDYVRTKLQLGAP